MGWLFGSVVGGYLLLVVWVYFFQSSLLYFPTRDEFTTPERAGLDFEEHYFTTQDQLVLHGWYLPGEPALETLLFFHGNAGNITHRLDSLRIFHEIGLNVFIFDYRGYGKSQGQPSEIGTGLDALAALEFLRTEFRVEQAQVIYFGRSLGGAVAAALAAVQNPKLLILESTFTSVPDLATAHYPYLPVGLLCRYRYASEHVLSTLHTPLLIVHSPHDEIIPFQHAKTLYQIAKGPKDFLEISGDHNSGFLQNRTRYQNGLRRFIEKYRSQQSGG